MISQGKTTEGFLKNPITKTEGFQRGLTMIIGRMIDPIYKEMIIGNITIEELMIDLMTEFITDQMIAIMIEVLVAILIGLKTNLVRLDDIMMIIEVTTDRITTTSLIMIVPTIIEVIKMEGKGGNKALSVVTTARVKVTLLGSAAKRDKREEMREVGAAVEATKVGVAFAEDAIMGVPTIGMKAPLTGVIIAGIIKKK